MKHTLITLLSSLLFLTSFCQEPMYQVRARETRPLTKETLNKAKALRDFIPGYPESWITSYVSVEIVTSYEGKIGKAIGPTDVLTFEQKNMLNTAVLGTQVVVNVKYKYDNLATDIEDKDIHVTMTVVPELEAEYVGGHIEMNKYLKKNVSDPLSALAPKKSQDGAVMFTVNEAGEIVNAKITSTSGDIKADKLFIDAISKMPKWNPAQNSKGEKIKQDFIFYLGGMGGC